MATYADFLRRACEGTVVVTATNAVETTYPASAGPQARARARPPARLD